MRKSFIDIKKEEMLWSGGDALCVFELKFNQCCVFFLRSDRADVFFFVLLFFCSAKFY